jgi:cytochrome c peroxidase
VRISSEGIRPPFSWEVHPGQAPEPANALVQPRAVAYRRSRDTLLIASEGWDALTEVDALAADPAMAVVRVHALGSAYDPFGNFPDHGGAPTGIALSRDERFAYVYCRSTFDVIQVELDTSRTRLAHLADDGLPADAAYGRRLFTNAKSEAISGGLACASCHPEGRDDAYVWREGNFGLGSDEGAHAPNEMARFVARRENLKLAQPGAPPPGPVALFPRQTPMLAGRVRANGPFGWHGENPDIVSRLFAGFHLHRAAWSNAGADQTVGEDLAKVDYLADFLRSGLLPPPTLTRALSSVEERGKALFESRETGCARCHVPAREFTDRGVMPLPPLSVRAGFDREEKSAFKTPSLWFIGGTAPYFHDGSAATLEDLLRTNNDRMGATNQLTEDDRGALAAYLRML